jgi:hypothetical protein
LVADDPALVVPFVPFVVASVSLAVDSSTAGPHPAAANPPTPKTQANRVQSMSLP